MNTRFIKKDGCTETIKVRHDIVINRNVVVENPKTGYKREVCVQTFNPTDKMLFEDGWEVFIENKPTQEVLLNNIKEKIINQIYSYHSSNNINVFYIGNNSLWLDKTLRTELKTRFDAEVKNGKTETVIWYNNTPFVFQLDKAIQLLCDLEIYASECYDKTQTHIMNIKNMDNIEEIEKYDFKNDYPEILKY
jgi:hypothetical protein